MFQTFDFTGPVLLELIKMEPVSILSPKIYVMPAFCLQILRLKNLIYFLKLILPSFFKNIPNHTSRKFFDWKIKVFIKINSHLWTNANNSGSNFSIDYSFLTKFRTVHFFFFFLDEHLVAKTSSDGPTRCNTWNGRSLCHMSKSD